MAAEKANWKETLNLPRTGFPMKANLQSAEPATIARWAEMNLYARLRAHRRGARKFVLHDGPPYANGPIHLGTAINKILKDFVVRSRSQAGFDAPYVPGWDCHGLPIELQVDRELGPRKGSLGPAEFRRECRTYAERFVDVQREGFKRLAVMGAWDHPYLTMNFPYQAAIVRALGRFVQQGMVYKGKKPVHWCIHCRTALAEAEVEYENLASPSIYVEFPLADGSRAELWSRVLKLSSVIDPISALIWTTTPWTIPSNLALAFHPDAWYGFHRVGKTITLVAEALADQVGTVIGRPFGPPLARVQGRALEHLWFRHPLYNRDSLGVLGAYVTLDQGTGVVHTAPGHGADDFNTGVQYGLDIYAPVGPGGHFDEDVELFGGQGVFDANPRIEEELAARGRLWHRANFQHPYPHCWRCHNPVIFLATSQWFIRMDANGFRQRALEAAARVEWFPAWGEERLRNMLAGRPDWCISRQRQWGVPIPAVDCTACGEAILTDDLVERAAGLFERAGADSWYERPVEHFVPAGLACPRCGGRAFAKEQDILDVWFDSGSSHEAVLARHPELDWPANVYLEGSDQYRGWFQSSLLVGVGGRGTAPFRQVITHGFVVDEQGRKMSKSLGNSVEPEEVIAQSGAEILRLWAAMVDYREEVRIGPEILARVVEAYRKIRNTCRILVANLYDFDPTTDRLPVDRLEEVDRYALSRYAEAALRIVKAYERYEFPTFFHTVNSLLTVDLSAFYVDVSKDRLYTLAPRADPRRSAQTAMYVIADGLARVIAPILPVTAEELWRFLPGSREESVHLAVYPDDLEALVDGPLMDRWQRLIDIREIVNRALEQQRKEKVFGNSLAARVHVRASDADAALLDQYLQQLPMLFIVSEVSVERRASGGAALEQVPVVDVHRARGERCDRCWRYVTELTRDADKAGICLRCADALEAPDQAA
ncbi:MAG: isoleucine--tRNA ligase [Acidobacteria bacterium]|nr:isoleucine--tRNA ligase [Acidobacteriota bacterium]